MYYLAGCLSIIVIRYTGYRQTKKGILQTDPGGKYRMDSAARVRDIVLRALRECLLWRAGGYENESG